MANVRRRSPKQQQSKAQTIRCGVLPPVTIIRGNGSSSIRGLRYTAANLLAGGNPWQPLGKGTEFVNTHPICTLFLDKLCDLNGRGEFYKAYTEVEALAKGLSVVRQ